jgi:hypothetical protein
LPWFLAEHTVIDVSALVTPISASPARLTTV